MKISQKKRVLCWGTGNVFREFLFAEDCADACRFCLENWNPDIDKKANFSNEGKLTYLNVGSGNEITIKDLAKLITISIFGHPLFGLSLKVGN